MKKSSAPTNATDAGKAGARNKGPIGGSANAAGADYGASVAAWACCRVLLGSRASLPWNQGDVAYIGTVSSECEEEVDDLNLAVGPEGKVYIQIKHGLRMGGEFDKGIAQLVRQFALTKLAPRDRLVLVTDGTATGSVRRDVPRALAWFRDLPPTTPLNEFPYGEDARRALERIQRVFNEQYVECTKRAPAEADWRRFLAITYLTELNTLDHGTDHLASLDLLKRIANDGKAGSVWASLNGLALKGARLRRPLDATAIRNAMTSNGIRLDLDEGGAYATVESCARLMTRGHIEGLQRRKQYVRDDYVQRKAIEQQLSRLTDEKIAVIVGGSGNGKTTWCAWKCDSDEPPLRLLFPAESIHETDVHMRATLHRLIDAASTEFASVSYSPAELHSWLKSTPMEVFVDGLDRALVTQRKLALWLERTATDIQGFEWRFTATTRPEIKSVVEQAVGDDAVLIEVGGYSEVEAMEAARRLRAPALAKYRNPRMMSFCARLWKSHGSQAFRHEEAVAHFIAESAARAARDCGMLLDGVVLALEDLGVALARSETGTLSGPSSRAFQIAHAAAYEALRKENLLVSAQSTVRVDIDDIAEHLAGRHTDVAAETSRWGEVRSIPLKAGALRAALEQLAVNSPMDAVRYVRELAGSSSVEGDEVLTSLLCAVIAAFEDPSPVKDVAAVLLATWQKENFFAAWGAGFDLLNLADSSRWSPMDRLELLWVLSPRENGLDWRSKHWIKPHIYTNNQCTPWRSRILRAVAQAGEAGWSFVCKCFDSQVGLMGSDEANLGDLAQGVFIETAGGDLPAALEFGDRIADRRVREKVMSSLASRYPVEILHLFLSEKTTLAPNRKLEVAEDMRADDWSAHPATAQLASHWLDRPEFATSRRPLLRLVAKSGNAAAAWELMAYSDLDSTEIGAIFSLDQVRFAKKLDDLLSRPGEQELVCDGLASENMRVEHVSLISARVLSLVQDEEGAQNVAKLCEHMIYLSMTTDAPAVELLDLASVILRFPSAQARSYLMYPASTARASESPGVGAGLQTQLLEMIAEFESDLKNLNTLCFKLSQNFPDSPTMIAYRDELVRKHPGLDGEDGPKHGFISL